MFVFYVYCRSFCTILPDFLFIPSCCVYCWKADLNIIEVLWSNKAVYEYIYIYVLTDIYPVIECSHGRPTFLHFYISNHNQEKTRMQTKRLQRGPH
jgi:hypothetical protein